MMNESDSKPQSESRSSGTGPGDCLQAARIQHGLSLEDVAKRMHLNTAVLKSIEDNNFEEITAPIFVKGYLRAYARIVSLDEDEMIEQYMNYYSEEDPPISSTSNMAPELSVADARIKWTTYLVILGLGALLAVWWWNKEQNQEAPISLEAPSSTIEQEPEIETRVETSEIEANSESLIESPEPIAEIPVQEPETELSETDPMPEPEAQQSETAAVHAAEPEPVESEVIAPVSLVQKFTDATGLELTRIAPSGSDELHIVVHADTWADIKDGSDHQMVYDLLRANQTISVMGEAPFSIFLGNGHGVEIKFNDQEIDLFSRIRDDNTARLKIGG